MAYNEDLANRIRATLKLYPDAIKTGLTEKKMFGGLSFLYHGKMTVGIVKEELAVRIISKRMDDVLKMDHVRPMDFTKRPMKEFIYVSEKGFRTEEQLLSWIELGIEHATYNL